MDLESLDPDRVEAAFLDAGALSVTFTDAGDDPVLEPGPGETPLWSDTRVTALFDETTDLSALDDDLCRTLGIEKLPAHRLECLADRNWEREWLSDFRPMRFGRRLWIVPGEIPDLPDDAIVVRLDPGLAFGTGTHPTTALCLGWLDRAAPVGASVLDFGCGSGILGIAALKLGAVSVVAVDIDLQAVTATRQNAERNLIESGLDVGTCLDPEPSRYDIVVANILAGTLVESRALLCDVTRPGGRIALSGILADQAEEVMAAYRAYVRFERPLELEGWVLLSGTRN